MTVFFSFAFRPFFLLACLYASLAMTAWMIWIAMYAMGLDLPTLSISLPPYQWHAHEMLFGYAMAVITGFFLTAVPNWTGTRPVQGATLIALTVAWLAGRMAIWLSAYLPEILVSVLDLSLIAMLFGLVVKALSACWSKRNFIFVPILISLFSANLMVHLQQMGVTDDTLLTGHQLALNTILLLIAIIGGRVVPAFTTNALRRNGELDLPSPNALFDGLAIGSIVLVAGGDVVQLDDSLRSGLAVAAMLASALRMTTWRTVKTFGQPMVWIMHLGYLWLIIGLGLKAAALAGFMTSETTAQHALTIGAIGSMTIGVMVRAALGHTGRIIQSSPAIVFCFTLISTTAIVRVFAPDIFPDYYNLELLVAGLMWIAAFGTLSVLFWPILTRPRVNS